MNQENTVTVCAECLQASCWQGEFMCEKSRFAETIEMTIEELEQLNLESEHYWRTSQ